MQGRAAVRRAARRAVSKLNTESAERFVMEPLVDDTPVVTPAERVMRRAVAVITALSIVVIGGGLMALTAVGGGRGRGYQVAPVLGLIMFVMFGLPAVAVLVRHLRGVWYDTQ